MRHGLRWVSTERGSCLVHGGADAICRRSGAGGALWRGASTLENGADKGVGSLALGHIVQRLHVWKARHGECTGEAKRSNCSFFVLPDVQRTSSAHEEPAVPTPDVVTMRER